MALGENASKVSRFSSYMRIVFDTKRDPEILVLASRVLGHLARAGGAMTADEVERQVTFLHCTLFPSSLPLHSPHFLFLYFRLKLLSIGFEEIESSTVDLLLF